MKVNRKLLVFCMFSVVFQGLRASPDVCTNTILPGSKGDTGEPGDIGEPGRQGKTGAPGQTGVPGETGFKGTGGHPGKTGPTGQKGDSGDPGLDGPLGLKGKPGSTCDCGRYRKVVGQMDINVAKLRNAAKFLKNVILGLRETDDNYFLLVKEARSYREAVIGCKLRGGVLAMPKTNQTNSVMADYLQKAGLTKVHIGLQKIGEDGSGSYVYSDASPLLRFSAWGQEEGASPSVAPPINSSCVKLHSTGSWAHTGCDISMFYICQFPKNRRGGRGEAVVAVS